MPDLNPALIAEIVAACKSGLDETTQTLGRFLEAKVAVELGEPQPLDIMADEFAGPGLAVLLRAGADSALVVLPEACGLVPAWIAAPDSTGNNKLTTLAQELSMLLLPDTLAVEDFRVKRVDDLSMGLAIVEPRDDAVRVPLTLTADDGRKGLLSLIVSCTQGAKLFDKPAAPEPAAKPADEAAKAGVLRGAEADVAAEQAEPAFATSSGRSFDDLPPYSRSLLRIRVPVVVVLAHKKEPLAKIVELGPGAIIQFRKLCEQPLDLEVNGQKVGEGEGVKVGDKFGLRVTGIKLPDERFLPVGGSPKR